MTFQIVAGQILRASTLNNLILVTYSGTLDNTSRTTTSVAYTETLTAAGLAGVAFTAGISGAVRIEWRGEMTNGSAGFNFMSINVRSDSVIGSGSVIVAASDDLAARSDFSAAGQTKNYSQFYIATGLTLGSAYNVSISQRCQTGTLTVNRRQVSVNQIFV